MKRYFLVAASAIVLLGAGAAALIVWLTREPPRVTDASGSAEGATDGPPLVALPAEPVARDRALELNELRTRLAALRRGFAAAKRDHSSEARLLPALDEIFPGRSPRWELECRGLLCRLEVQAPQSEWREPLAANKKVRPHAERLTFDPDEEHVAFVELVELRVADGPERPEGERILQELEEKLLASEAARGCLAKGTEGGAAEVLLMIERSGITYRFGSATDRAVAYCLTMQAMPDVVGGVSAPAGVHRAERRVRLAPSR